TFHFPKRCCMRRKFILIVGIAFLCIGWIATISANENSSDEKIELTVSAAASLQDVLDEIKEIYENEHPDIKLNFNFGSSGTLQKQISQGAPVDLFFSASEKYFAPLLEKNEIIKEDYVELLSNELVLITPKKEQLLQSTDDLTKLQ